MERLSVIALRRVIRLAPLSKLSKPPFSGETALIAPDAQCFVRYYHFQVILGVI